MAADALAADVWLCILGHLDDPRDICAAASVSRQFRVLADSDEVWGGIFKRTWELQLCGTCVTTRQVAHFKERFRELTVAKRRNVMFLLALTRIRIRELEEVRVALLVRRLCVVLLLRLGLDSFKYVVVAIILDSFVRM